MITIAEPTITIIDSIMGSGKTSWAIQYMNEHQEKPYLYITPLLTETKRICAVCNKNKSKDFVSPQNFGNGKLENLKQYVARGVNIAATHQLFVNIDDELRELFRQQNYNLFIDEELPVIKGYNDTLLPEEKISRSMTAGDIKFMLDTNAIAVEDGSSTGFIKWCHQGEYEEFKHLRVQQLANKHELLLIENKSLFWVFSPETWSLFENTYIMTYQIKGTIEDCYFQYYKIPYKMQSVEKDATGRYSLCDYDSEKDMAARRGYQSFIDILEDEKLNNICKANPYKKMRGQFSDTWYAKNFTKSKGEMKLAFDKVRKHRFHASSKEIMWTTFADYETRLKIAGAICTPMPKEMAKRLVKLNKVEREQVEKKYKCFVPVNAKATNDYSDRTKLFYWCNMFINPELNKFFKWQHCNFDENKFATNILIQWIWRSAIRKPEPEHIQIYIPSERMRDLLKKWLSMQ